MGAVYDQLSITERRKIERWRHAKFPVDEMARVLKRCRSTIFRELKRNHFSDESMPGCDGYYGAAAHMMQADRRARERKLIKHPELCKRVIERIKNGWTPEQISNRMIHERAPSGSARKPFIATSIPRKVSAKTCGGICRRTVSPADHVAPEGAENLNSTAMSVSFSDPMMSRIVGNLVTGRPI